jgi:hypothetical protein
MNALPTHCDFSAADFDATAITAGGVRVIQVTGSARCRGAGWRLDFVPANGGVVPDRERIHLTIRETAPRRAGRFWAQASVETMIEDSQATAVVVHFGWRPSIVIPVRETSAIAGVSARAWREPVAEQSRAGYGLSFATAGRMV